MNKVKITVKGEVGKIYQGDQEYTGDLSLLDGIDCQDCFSDYFDDEPWTEIVKDGYMKFEYDNTDKKLYTITEYTSSEKLTDEELSELEEYTCGQWSDGIGEGFEQQPCYDIDGEEIYISPWFRNQKTTITQK